MIPSIWGPRQHSPIEPQTSSASPNEIVIPAPPTPATTRTPGSGSAISTPAPASHFV